MCLKLLLRMLGGIEEWRGVVGLVWRVELWGEQNDYVDVDEQINVVPNLVYDLLMVDWIRCLGGRRRNMKLLMCCF